MTALSIIFFLLAIGISIALAVFSLKIKNKHYHLEILETKVRSIEKRITKEQNDHNELKIRLEEQKIALNKKWQEIQNNEKILEEKALKAEKERRVIKEEQAKITSEKIDFEQQQLTVQKIIDNFKNKLTKEKEEIIEEKQRVTEEQNQIRLIKESLESQQSQMKIEYYKFEKERNYLSARFKELEISKRDLELLNNQLLGKEKQLKEVEKRLIEEKIRIDKEREKLDIERRKIHESRLELRPIEDGKIFTKFEIPELTCYKINNSQFNIVFQKPGGNKIALQPKSSRFRLDGNIIRDDDDVAPLFGDKLPKIIDNQLWNNIDLIVIGEEGRGNEALRWKLKLEKNSQQLDLNQVEQQGKTAILSQSKKNWFFICFYNSNNNLIDSLVFRFIRGLNAVEVSKHPYLPGFNGHQATKIKFLHQQSCTVRILNNEKNGVSIDRNELNTIANIPPEPKWDVTHWEIEDDSKRKIDIKIFMNRIWWNLANLSGKLNRNDATDKIMEIPFDKFQSSSHIGIDIWLPKRHRIQQISIGFDIYDRKNYQVKGSEEKLFIPLRDLIDDDKLQNLRQRQQIKLWLDDIINEFIRVAVVLPPWLSCKVINCNFKTREQDEMIVHVEDNHVHHFFRELSYEEIRLKYDMNLPTQIYQCGYCGDYVPADNHVKNPTSAIIEHIDQCLKAEIIDGSVHIKFRIVKDSTEIRTNVITDLPHVWKCNLCDSYFENQKVNEMVRHLISDHESDVYS